MEPRPGATANRRQTTRIRKGTQGGATKDYVNNHGKNLSNLAPQQSQILNLLKNNKQLIIKPTDKNLGPAVMETEIIQNKSLRSISYLRITSSSVSKKQNTCLTSLKTPSKNL